MKHLLILALLIVSITFGQSKAGITAASFLGIGTGARAMGMAGAVTAIAGDAANNYWNPGSISRIKGNQIHFTGADWLVDTKWNLFSAIIHPDANKAIGIYLTHLDYGEEVVTTVDEQNGTNDYWSAVDIAFGLAYCQNLTDRFSMGTTAKYIYQSIYNETASSGAMDVGLLYQNVAGNLRLGMNISNIGFDMIMEGKDLYKRIDLDPDSEGNNETIVASLKTDYWPLPIIFRVGVSTDILVFNSKKMTVAIDGVLPSDDVEYFNIGGEFQPIQSVLVRCGYRQLGNSSSEEGFTIGFGLKYLLFNLPVEFNYAYHDFGVFSYLTHLGITLKI